MAIFEVLSLFTDRQLIQERMGRSRNTRLHLYTSTKCHTNKSDIPTSRTPSPRNKIWGMFSHWRSFTFSRFARPANRFCAQCVQADQCPYYNLLYRPSSTSLPRRAGREAAWQTPPRIHRSPSSWKNPECNTCRVRMQGLPHHHRRNPSSFLSSHNRPT